MELSPEVLHWLGHTMERRAAGLEIPANPIQMLVDGLEALRLAKYMILAAFTLVIYDIIITYGREVQHIWGSRWTFIRAMFSITRYFVPIIMLVNLCCIHLSSKRTIQRVRNYFPCRMEMRFMATTGIFANAVMMSILLARVWAMWGRQRWMLGVLLAVFMGSQLPPAILVGREVAKIQVIDNPLPSVLTGCVATSASSASAHWVHLFITSLTYESTLFLFTLAQAWNMSRRGVGTPIMTLLTRDGAWYFLVVIGSVSLTAIGTSVPKTQSAALLSQFFIAITSCTCCRLLLRLRGFYTPTDQSTGTEGAVRSRSNTGEISMNRYPSRKTGVGARPGIPVVLYHDSNMSAPGLGPVKMDV
ncbi:hypothetical protein BDV93DRAFT_551918 [Ceratobasidium sp. AG-I]|nr:hypothetical protein BDV93DRAFT_551918 [Ceratobasidium sp. AG-I]